MDDIREIVAKNIVTLRKKSGLTQVELAKKINFSDKAVSRWEKGEVLPDVETLQKLSEVFNVSISSILEIKDDLQKNKSVKLTKKDVLSQVFLICEIWSIIAVIYSYFNLSRGMNLWQIFVWGIPATSLFLILQTRKKQNNISSFVYGTIFVWSFITCVFLTRLKYNPWYIFLLGIPLQGMLIVRYVFDFKHESTIKNKKINSKK